MGNQDEQYPVNRPPMQPPASRPLGSSRPLPGNTPRPEPTQAPVRRGTNNAPPPNNQFQRRSLGRALNDAFTGMQSAIQGPPRDRPRRDAGSADARWDEPQSRRDPWDRQWADWSAQGNANNDGGYTGDDPSEGRRHGRAAWGGWPDAGTRASVATNAVGARKNTQRRGSASQSRAQSFHELLDWARTGFSRQAMPSRKAINLLLVVCILGALLLSTVGLTFAGYNDYSSVLAGAKDGQTALTKMAEDLGLGKSGKATDTVAAYNDLTLALNDFQMVHDRLAHPDFILGVAGHLPIVDQKLQSGLALSAIGIQAIQMMQAIFPAIVSISKVVATSPISATGDAAPPAAELLGKTDIDNLTTGFTKAQPYIANMIAIVNSTPPDTLAAALNSKQRGEILPFLQFVPQLPNAIEVVKNFLPLAPTVLGIADPKGNPLPGGVAYVLTTLDNSEIRPVGGFQGQMAIFGVAGGHISHISLQDVYQLEPVSGQGSDYSQYRPNAESWWPLDWNIRNSGLSPDFPTSAQYTLNELNNQYLCKRPLTTPYPPSTDAVGCPGARYFGDPAHYYKEGNHVPIVDSKTGAITGYNPTPAQMGGMIVIQQTIIKQLLQRTGPIQVACPYNISVNADNLQQLIHYYQETAAGRKIGANPCAGGASDATKRFSSIVATTLLNKLKTISKTDLFAYIGDLLQDLKTRDIQIYLANPSDPNFGPYSAGENFLKTYNANSTVYTGAGDSLLINQANFAGDKLNLYMRLKLVDHISLDTRGTAHHQLEIDYIYNIPTIKVNPADATSQAQAWQVDVYNTIFNAQYSNFYAEYRRVYVPQNAQFDYGSGKGLLGRTGQDWTLTSGPAIGVSDVVKRAVFGDFYQYNFGPSDDGKTITWSTPDNVTNPQMGWYVPNMMQNGAYSLMLQRQSGVPTSADITITCNNNSKTLAHIVQDITVDTPISVPTAGC